MLDKPLPSPPVAVPQVVVTVASEACPAPTVRHFEAFGADQRPQRTQLPPFRQSKRWARKYNSNAKPVISNSRSQNLAVNNTEEESESRDNVVPFEDEVPRSSMSDDSSIHSAKGFCRPAALPGWHSVRESRLAKSMTGSRFSSKSTIQHPHPRKNSRDRVTWARGPRVSLPKAVRKRRSIRTRHGCEDLRELAGTLGRRSQINVTSFIADTSGVRYEDIARSKSPVPTLHDVDKDRRFSQECEALLGQVDFEQGWSLDGNQHSGTSIAPFSVPTTQADWSHPRANNSRHESQNNQGSSTRPELPARISSHNATRAKPKLFGNMQREVDANHDQQGPRTGATGTGVAMTKGKGSGMSCSLPGLCFSSSSKRNDATGSTDTLNVIEAQVMNTPSAAVIEKLREKTAFIVQSPRLKRRSAARLSGVGSPPERPLPKLPIAASRSSEQGLTNDDAMRKIDATPGHAVLQTIREVKPALTDLSAHPSPTDVSGRLSLSTHTDEDETGVPISRRGRGGLRQRGDIIRKHMNQHYNTTPEEPEQEPDMSSTLQAEVVDLKTQLSFSELDKFPTVPTSRPSSRTSTTAARTRAHARQSSYASITRRRPGSTASRGKADKPESQILRRSNIMVLVDTDPTTDTFRAGAMSPDLSMYSQENSPAKVQHTRAISDISRARLSGPKTRKSLRSLRSQASGKSSANTKKTRARASPVRMEGPVSSDDECQPLMARPRKPSSSRHRRVRTASQDEASREELQREMYKVQGLLDEQYDLILRQEQRLREQAEEIMMMRRIMAPMRRINTLDIITDEDEEEEEVELPPVVPLKQKALRPSKKPMEAKKTTSWISSSGSATSEYTANSDTAGSRSASLTDPTEYDIPEPPPKDKHFEVASSMSRSGISVRVNGKPMALREPPPVAVSAPRKSLESPKFVPIEVAAVDEAKNVKRLSVNHVLTDTAQMDRAIDALRAFG